MKRFLAMLLALLALLTLTACGASAQNTNLMNGVTANAISATADHGLTDPAMADFAVELFRRSVTNDKNTLVSPLSILCALSMTANGASGETLAQMEAAFGVGVGELNNYLHQLIASLPDGEKCKLHLANSIWFKDADSFAVEQAFLQTNADYYGAGLYKAPFNDTTLKSINKWVDENTYGMIDSILNEIPAEAKLYLINALAFDAEWETVYKDTQVRSGIFTLLDGSKRDAELMYSREHRYLEDENAAGFLKYYAGGDYAFAVLLPNEGLSVTDYAASLTGESLLTLLQNAQDVEVKAAIPKFVSEYSVELSDILKAMGMTDAFDMAAADFSALGSSADGNIYISRVLHKTYIAVDEKGTRAGAVTAVEEPTAAMPPEEPKTVYLDRPFVYMLIDCETNLPFFIGAVTDTGA